MAWSEWKKFGGGSYLTAENTNHSTNSPHSLSLDTKSISSGILVVLSTLQSGGADGSASISGATIEETILDNSNLHNTKICFFVYKLKNIGDTLTVTQNYTASFNNRDLKIALIY